MGEREESLRIKKIAAEIDNLRAEQEKFAAEAASARGAQLRAWIVSLSIVIGIGVSVLGIYETLSEVAFRNRQLGLESQVQSNEMFLNQVLNRMSGIKVVHKEVDSNTGELTLKSQDSYGDVIQVGSYGAAVALACQFDNLTLAAQTALTFQLAHQPLDIAARDMLQRIENGCPPGWDRLTDTEKDAWFKRATMDKEGRTDVGPR